MYQVIINTDNKSLTDEELKECLKDKKTLLNDQNKSFKLRYFNIAERMNELFVKDGKVDEGKIPQFTQALLQRIKFVRIISDKGEQVYQLFETLNDRGQNLTQTELLKNFLLSKLNNTEELQNQFLDLWKQLVDNNSRISLKGTSIFSVDVMLRNYFLAYFGEKITKKEVYEKFKDELKGYSPDELMLFIRRLNDKLETIAKIYQNIPNSKVYRFMNFAIQQLNISQLLPTLFLIARDDVEQEQATMILNKISKFISFVWISDKPYNIIEQFNIATFSKISESKCDTNDALQQFISNAEDHLEKLKPKSLVGYVKDKQFEDNDEIRQFLIALSSEFQPKLTLTQPTLEHINPQKGIDNYTENGFVSKTESDEYIYKLGNLVVLDAKENSHAKDKWEDKITTYSKEQQPDFVKLLIRRLNDEDSSKTYADKNKILNDLFYVDLPSITNLNKPYLSKEEIDRRSEKYASSIINVLSDK